jgi:protein-disulfide isomerase
MANAHKKKKKTQMSTITMVTVLVVFIGLGVFAIINSFAGKDNPGEETARVLPVEYDGQPAIGDDNAPVKLMEFGDYKCPVCKVFHDTVYPKLKKEYIDTGKVQMYFTNYQFIGEDSITAGMAGEAVYQQDPAAYWKFYDAIYNHQKDESVKWATPDFLEQLIEQNIPEVDAKKVREDLDNKTYLNEVTADNNKAKKLNIESVPAVFVNGKKVENALDYEALKKMIDSELANKEK